MLVAALIATEECVAETITKQCNICFPCSIIFPSTCLTIPVKQMQVRILNFELMNVLHFLELHFFLSAVVIAHCPSN